ncbi:MAG: putative Ig domain-containing protein [Halobacteriales archaeon]|nr:putative Ig domain-containing protein [Halobacteriales archaeon]
MLAVAAGVWLLGSAACETVTTTDPSVLGTIQGKVSVSGGPGLADVEVRIAGPVADTVLTGSTGDFEFARVPGGEYSVTIVGGPPEVSFPQRSAAAVIGASGETVRVDFVGAYPPVEILTSSLAAGQQNQAYSDTLEASGGSGTFEWTVESGRLPEGLALGAESGIVSGTPTSVETQTFSIRAVSAGDTARSSISLSVFPDGLQITTTALPSGQVGVAYSADLTTVGGSGSVEWWVEAGSLPGGLSLDATSGRIQGIPSDAGVSSFTVGATSAADTAFAELDITVGAVGGLIHRWRFGEEGPAGTALLDDIGGAHGTLVNTGSNDGQVFGGAVILEGGTRSIADYVELPSGLLSGLTDATIEVWATPLSVQGSATIFEIGTDTTDHIAVTWSRDGRADQDLIEWKAGGDQLRIEDALAPYALGAEHHVVLTFAWDPSSTETTVRWFKDGTAVGSSVVSGNLSELGDLSAWLGRSLDPSERTANASYNELRIYSEALDAEQIAISGANPPAPPPSVDSVRLSPDTADVYGGETRTYLIQILDSMGNELPGRFVRWSVADPSFAAIDSVTGVISGLSGGVTTVTATVEGVTDDATLVVLPGNLNSWVGGTGLWSEPANWSRNRLPTQTDSAVIDQAGMPDVTVDAAIGSSNRFGALTVGSPEGGQTLIVQYGLSVDGAVYVGPEASLRVSCCNQLTPRASFTVDGFLSNRGTISLQGVTNCSENELLIRGVMEWTRGFIDAPSSCRSTFRIAESGSLEIAGPEPTFGDPGLGLGLDVIIEGSAIWASGNLTQSRGDLSISAGGELLVDTATVLRASGSSHFRVEGVMRKRNSPLNSSFEIPIELASGGVIDIQAGGVVAKDTVWLEGTVLLSDTSTTLFASDVFDFQTTGRIVGGGTVDLSAAAISFFSGTVQPGGDGAGRMLLAAPPVGIDQLAPSLFELDVGDSATGHDLLEIQGSVTLGGDLAVDTIGTFAPVAGDRFPILVFGSRSGGFSNVTLPTLSGVTLDTIWTSGNVQDTLFVVVNDP